MPFALLILLLTLSCQTPKTPAETPPKTAKTQTDNWIGNATIYEANIRQMTEEGTFKAFEEQHLDRISKMGVRILWLMPIFPIGEKNRKGTLGSYYAVQDYRAVNSEHGTMEEFKHLVNAAHKKGMRVILDWVANHTAWDNAWVAENPNWYTTDSTGKMLPPVADWADVADLNYDNEAMREAMIESMEFWLREADVDGFRCDVAEMVPMDFWVEARQRLDAVKPIFFLAEGEKPELHKAFDMTYAWSFHHLMNAVAKGEKGASDIANYWAAQDSIYKSDDLRMQFITNHDENSWNGTAIERMGNNRKNFAVLSYTVPGMPLIYSGQEADINKRLAFFEKDVIDWDNNSLVDFYKKLTKIKSEHSVLASGAQTAPIKFYDTGNESVVFFTRLDGDNEMLVLLNFSDYEVEISVSDERFNGKYVELTGDGLIKAKGSADCKLSANGYRIFYLL